MDICVYEREEGREKGNNSNPLVLSPRAVLAWAESGNEELTLGVPGTPLFELSPAGSQGSQLEEVGFGNWDLGLKPRHSSVQGRHVNH